MVSRVHFVFLLFVKIDLCRLESWIIKSGRCEGWVKKKDYSFFETVHESDVTNHWLSYSPVNNGSSFLSRETCIMVALVAIND